MKGYGQFCPIARAAEVLGERWTMLVVRELGAGSESFNDLRRGLPRISPSLLSTRLKSLEAAGVVNRSESDAGVRYTLTESGRELKGILLSIGTWGQRWAPAEFTPDEPDPSMLMWDIHRSMNTAYFGAQRTVLMFEFGDQAGRFRRWWLVVTDGDVDICMKDPGHEINLHVTTDVAALTGIWMGSLSITSAQRSGRLRMNGSGLLRRDIRVWLGTNYFARVKSAR